MLKYLCLNNLKFLTCVKMHCKRLERPCKTWVLPSALRGNLRSSMNYFYQLFARGGGETIVLPFVRNTQFSCYRESVELL